MRQDSGTGRPINQHKMNKKTSKWSDGYKGVSSSSRHDESKEKTTHAREQENREERKEETARKTGNKQHGLRSSVASSKLTELRDHSCSVGPHKILTGLLGQSARLGLLVVQTFSFVGMLIIILDDPRWVWHAAERLGAKIAYPPQYTRAAPAVWPGTVRA